MGLPAARQGDMTMGHGPYGPAAFDVGSENVLINNKGAVFSGLVQTSVHPSTPPIPPDVPITPGEGSTSVIINGAGAIRIGDMTVCGGIVIEGSSNVLIGG